MDEYISFGTCICWQLESVQSRSYFLRLKKEVVTATPFITKQVSLSEEKKLFEENAICLKACKTSRIQSWHGL